MIKLCMKFQEIFSRPRLGQTHFLKTAICYAITHERLKHVYYQRDLSEILRQTVNKLLSIDLIYVLT